MAEMVGFSRALQRRGGVVGGLFAALRVALSPFARPGVTRLHLEEWPDYLLRDVGISRASLESSDPRQTDWRPTDWLGR